MKLSSFKVCHVLVMFFVLFVSLVFSAASARAVTVDVSYLSSYRYSGTLDDGSELTFYMSSSYYSTCYCIGAKTDAVTLSIPDSIRYNNKLYSVYRLGYSSSEPFDLSEAPNVKTVYLPSSVSTVYCDFPDHVTDVHAGYDGNMSINGTFNATLWVPKTAFSNYAESSSYRNYNICYEGWEKQSVTIDVPMEGTFAQVIVNNITNWADVDELTVTGHLNSTDFGYFNRLSNLRKLDLSGTDITFVEGCKSLYLLSEVVLPSTVKRAGEYAFYRCYRLKDFSFESIDSIGKYAFEDCYSLTELVLPKVTGIGEGAFSGCLNIMSVSAPNLLYAGGSCFADCDNLVTASLPCARTLEYGVFYDCDKLQEVDIKGCLNLGSSAFYTCDSLRSIHLNDAISTIKDRCFYGCKKLTDINIPSSLVTIETYAFYNSGLTEIILPEGLQKIGNYAFNGTPAKRLSIPSTIQSIGSSAFYQNSSAESKLEEVICKAVIPVSNSAFNTSNLLTVKLSVPEFSVSAYKLQDDWYKFGTIVGLGDQLSDVTFFSQFLLYSKEGLADKANFTLDRNTSSLTEDYAAKLNISVAGDLSLGKFVQRQNFYHYSNSKYNSETGSYEYTMAYPYATSLLNNTNVTADTVIMQLSVPRNEWTFISFPFNVNVSDITYPEGTRFVIRKYNSENRAAMSGDTWENVTDGQIMKAGTGYIIHCTNDNGYDYSYEGNNIEFTFKAVNDAYKNNVFASTDVSQQLSAYPSEFLHNSGWNLIGNPYPCYFNTTYMEHSGVITTWNGSGYTAYSLTDDDYVLRPNEAFFVQSLSDDDVVKYDAQGRMLYGTISTSATEDYATRAKSRYASKRFVYNIYLSDEAYADRARVVVNEAAKLDYEVSCDASKFMSSNAAVPQIYVIENGSNLSIDERPLADGTVKLGIKVPETGTYTISLPENPDTNMSALLIDNEAKTTTDLSQGSYTFSASKGILDSRFTLKLNSETSGISNPEVNTSDSRNSYYDIAGKRLTQPQSGFNIINGQKVIVK